MCGVYIYIYTYLQHEINDLEDRKMFFPALAGVPVARNTKRGGWQLLLGGSRLSPLDRCHVNLEAPNEGTGWSNKIRISTRYLNP